MKKGVLAVMSGFSGAGKGTIVKELLKKNDRTISPAQNEKTPRSNQFDLGVSIIG